MVRRAKIYPRENSCPLRQVPPMFDALRQWVGIQDTGRTEDSKDILICHIDVSHGLFAIQWGEAKFEKN